MKARGSLLQDTRTLLSLGAVGGLTDGELLGLFLAGRRDAAEVAFSTLVERHGPMVLRVCRSILRDEHDAQDALQATFLVLVHRASKIRAGDSLRSWLHGAALRVAACDRGATVRRRKHERKAGQLAPTDFVPRDVEPDVAPLVHEALARLPERYRTPVLLCDLEGLGCEEAARRLNWPVGTVKSRLARGRDRLRSRLVRLGLAPSALLLTLESMLPAEAAPPMMSTALIESTVRAASQLGGGRPLAGMVPSGVLSMMEGALKTMRAAKFARIGEGILAAVILTAGVGGISRAVSGRVDPEAPVPAQGPRRPLAARPGDLARPAEVGAESPERLLLRSRECIEKLEPGFEKARLLSELATAQAELGFRGDARATGHRAAEIAGAIAEESTRVNELREAARALGRAGDLDAAMAAEAKIGTASAMARSYRAFVLQEVGDALVKSGFLDEAKRVLDAMRGKGLDINVLAWFLASAQATAGDIAEALRTAESIPDEFMRVGAMVGMAFDASTYYDEHEGGIALARFQSGDRAGAERTLGEARAFAERVADPKSRGRALSLIGRAMLKMGDQPGAIGMARDIRDDAGRDRLLVDIATAHADAGRWEEAMRAVESIRGDAPRLVALNRVGVARGKARDLDGAKPLFARALEIAGRLKLDGQDDPTGPIHVALAQAQAGDYRGAKETLLRRANREPDELAEVVAVTQARAGEFARAMFTLQALPASSSWRRSEVLGEIVRLMVESGDDMRVLDWVDGFDSPASEARVLIGTARGIAGRKRPRPEGR